MAAWVLAFALAACNPGFAPEPTPRPSVPDYEAEGMPTPAPLDQAAVPVVALAGLPHHRVDVPGGPDWLAQDADRGGIFVKLDRGDVAELDPATGAVLRTLGAPAPLCQGIGAGFGGVWTCGGAGVRRLEIASGEQTRDLPVRKAFEQGHLPAAFGQVWVLTGTGEELVGLNPADGSVATTVALDARGHDLVFAPEALWVVSGPDDLVLGLYPRQDVVAMRIGGIDNPRAVAVARDVWVAAPSGVYRIDRTTGALLGAIGLPLGQDTAIAADPNDVWVRSAAGFLHRIDARTGEVVERIDAGIAGGGDVLLTPDAVWVTAYDANVVVRLARQR